MTNFTRYSSYKSLVKRWLVLIIHTHVSHHVQNQKYQSHTLLIADFSNLQQQIILYQVKLSKKKITCVEKNGLRSTYIWNNAHRR